jgi:hypothetical protein
VSLSTYGDLKDEIAAWATRADLTTVIPTFVLWADEEIARRLRCNAMLASANVTLSAETVAQPTGFLALKAVYLDVTQRRFLAVVSPEAAQERSATYGTDTYPDSVAVEGANLRFAPQFSGTTTVAKVTYYKRQVALSADADTNVVLAAYPFLYLYGALEALFRYLEDDNNADRYGGQFGALIESVNAESAKDVMRGPLVPRPYGAGVA